MLLAHGEPLQSPLSPRLHPDVVVFVALLALAYWLALGPRRPADEPPATRRQIRFLAGAIVTLFVFSEWPVHDLAEGYLYSVHMVQHSVYTLVLPPLFILGTPPWLWRRLLPGSLMGAFRHLTRPWAAVLLFSAVTVATHLPAFVTAAVRSGPAHFGQHLALVLAAVVVWWPIVGPLPEAPRLTAPVHQVVYVFFQSLVPSIVGSSLLWATSVPYRVGRHHHGGGRGRAAAGLHGVRVPADRAAGAAVLDRWRGPPGPRQALISTGVPMGNTWASLVIPELLMRMQPLLTSVPRLDGSPVPCSPSTPVPPSPKE
jgi:putative membrane protein